MATQLNVYQFPNNVADTALIPLSALPIPLAALALPVNSNSQVIIRGTVGWVDTESILEVNQTSVLFKIWRGAPFTGTLIFSVRDSSESWADRNKTTSFVHVDDNSTESKDITYVLTAELVTVGQANVVGPLFFFVSDVNAN
jgi:hypothetical protein